MIERMRLVLKIWQIIRKYDIGQLWFALELLDEAGPEGQQVASNSEERR